jgi:hypothetical protein
MDYLNHKIIEEMVRGGTSAYYRPSHLAPDKHARYRVAPPEERYPVRAKLVCIRLPWLFAIIRLPLWSPIGVSLE